MYHAAEVLYNILASFLEQTCGRTVQYSMETDILEYHLMPQVVVTYVTNLRALQLSISYFLLQYFSVIDRYLALPSSCVVMANNSSTINLAIGSRGTSSIFIGLSRWIDHSRHWVFLLGMKSWDSNAVQANDECSAYMG